MAKFKVIVNDDGIFVPQANGLYKLVPDEELGSTLRATAAGEPEKPAKKKRGPNKVKRVALGPKVFTAGVST